MFHKIFLIFFFSVSFCEFPAQNYSAKNISLVAKITPNMTDFGYDGRRYSGCWAWYQQNKNKEYAISGTSNGTYFIDISSPASPSVSAFVQAAQGCTYREMKTYLNYCYIVSDDGQPLGFQIIDLQNLPGGVSTVHQGSKYFEKAHTIYIDKDRMYLGSVTYSNGYSSMAVYSLATPTAPVLMARLEQYLPFIGIVHDMFVRNDTIYASCANQGLILLKFNPTDSSISQIGSYSGYPKAGYNHSSFLTQNGKYLMFCDEIPSGSPIHMVNVQNPANIQSVQTLIPHPGTTPHNPYLLGNDFAIVSCYEDGLYVYDISDPNNPGVAGYFDTYPQSGANTGIYGSINYRGNWGAYPYLPSKLIVANDIQNGVFILDASAAYTTTVKDPVSVEKTNNETKHIRIFPNPASESLIISYSGTESSEVKIIDHSGQVILEKKHRDAFEEIINLTDFSSALYFVFINVNGTIKTEKLIIQH